MTRPHNKQKVPPQNLTTWTPTTKWQRQLPYRTIYMFVIFKNLVIDETMNGSSLYSPGHKLTVLFWLLLINADSTMYLLLIFLILEMVWLLAKSILWLLLFRCTKSALENCAVFIEYLCCFIRVFETCQFVLYRSCRNPYNWSYILRLYQN